MTSKKDRTYWNNKPININTKPVQYNDIIDINFVNLFSDFFEQYSLPSSLTWNIVMDYDEEIYNKISIFLSKYYTDYELFKTIYTTEYLKLFCDKSIFLLITTKSDNEIVGTVCIKNTEIFVFNKKDDFAYINYLCVHPKYRKTKLVSILMDELTRYVVREIKMNKGFYLTTNKIPNYNSVIRVYRRPINYLKLSESGYMKIETTNLNKLVDSFLIKRKTKLIYEKMEEKHLEQVYKLYNLYNVKYNIYINYSYDDIKKLLLNNNIISSYVFLDEEKNNVIDFVSFIKYECKTEIYTISNGTLFLHSCNNIISTELIKCLLWILSEENIDMLNVNDTCSIQDVLLNTMLNVNEDSDYESYTETYENKFVKGNKKMYVGFYNYKCQNVNSNNINLYII